jgi:HEAT repeat protein
MADDTLPPRFRVVRTAAVLAVSVALVGCAQYIGTTAASFLKVAREDKDPNKRYLAYARLASPNCYDTEDQKVRAAEYLAKILTEGREYEASRAVICRTLGELRVHQGREAVRAAADDENDLVRAEALRALGKIGRPEDVSVLSRHMTADKEDCRYAAIEGIGELKPQDPNVEAALVDGMEDLEPGVRVASYRALKAITGKDLGSDPEAWRKDAQDRAEKAAAKAGDATEKAKAKTPARR